MYTLGLWCVLIATLCCSHGDVVYNDVMIFRDYGQKKIVTCVLSDQLTHANCTPLQLDTPDPLSPGYDPVEDYIYWTEVNLNTVCRATFSGDLYDHKWKSYDSDLRALAIDPSMRLLFVTTQEELVKIDLTTEQETIIMKQLGNILISLDTNNQKIYTFNVYSTAVDHDVMNYDGSERRTITFADQAYIGDIAVTDTGKIYLCGEIGLQIYNVRLQESRNLRPVCSSVTVYEGNVYYPDLRRVFILSQTGDQDLEISYTGDVSSILDLTVSRRRECGHCQNDDVCDNVTGICPGSCKPGWTTDKCYTKCGYCENGDACNSSTWICPGDCKPGWTTAKCDEKCGHCKSGGACDRSTAVCVGDCEPGWTTAKCDTKCGHCLNDDVCDSLTGTCPRGCKPGWSPASCDTECGFRTYGMNCDSNCGHCLHDDVCDNVTGICPQGCKPGWTTNRCDTQCVPGTYGINCLLKCGHCLDDDVCDTTIGVCPRDCKRGWTNEKCDTECGHCLNNDACESETGICPGGCQPGWTTETCNTGKSNPFFFSFILLMNS